MAEGSFVADNADALRYLSVGVRVRLLISFPSESTETRTGIFVRIHTENSLISLLHVFGGGGFVLSPILICVLFVLVRLPSFLFSSFDNQLWLMVSCKQNRTLVSLVVRDSCFICQWILLFISILGTDISKAYFDFNGTIQRLPAIFFEFQTPAQRPCYNRPPK